MHCSLIFKVWRDFHAGSHRCCTIFHSSLKCIMVWCQGSNILRYLKLDVMMSKFTSPERRFLVSQLKALIISLPLQSFSLPIYTGWNQFLTWCYICTVIHSFTFSLPFTLRFVLLIILIDLTVSRKFSYVDPFLGRPLPLLQHLLTCPVSHHGP